MMGPGSEPSVWSASTRAGWRRAGPVLGLLVRWCFARQIWALNGRWLVTDYSAGDFC